MEKSNKNQKKSEYGIEWGRLFRRLSPYNVKKGLKYLSHYGLKGFWVKLNERFQIEEIPYESWIVKHLPSEEELKKQEKTTFDSNPYISVVVPAFETPENFLRELIECMQKQSYRNWELCIADASIAKDVENVVKSYHDERIKYKRLEENAGISENTNRAIEMAEGEFIGLLDHDDLLAFDSMYQIAKVIDENIEVDVIYSDEDKISEDSKEHFRPHFKPDFNLDLLRSNNYICHFFVVRKSLAAQVGGIRQEFDGAQDYDFIFRCIENARLIKHIPRILYHWRVHKNSTAENPASKMYAYEAGKRAIEEHLMRQGVEGNVCHTRDIGFYRVNYPVTGNPFVSIIIPNKDNVDILNRCLESIENSNYKNYEIIIVENNSEEDRTFSYYRELEKKENLRVVVWEKEFNYSAINNFGRRFANGEYLVLLNNDIEIIENQWLEEMLGHCQRPEVGIVGARLFYPDDTIQHAGTVIGIGGIAGHIFTGLPRSHTGYMHKAGLQLNLSAVTAACLMVKTQVFDQVNGFEEKLSVAFNDVDFCLKVRQADYLVVYDPYVEAYHYESKTRGAEDSKEKVRRFQSEIEFMRERWIHILKEGDPYYNPNLTLTKWNYSLKEN
ncbi:glycosyltransferase family 2 protein [Anaerosacchariphilus polymeriproducens]|uniref:Glycosyltransferase family 2 protein n=1 Tax=Anaerosacchariphilus polymeriproducens TaxID=1812858 RepID=A0A371ARH3_9FIRM|nr:glycosyltransferase family 2 protein [Anaerosacchariphilus polymeriproducens]RDU22142.1 glycosyltransferase family 2 protein [Anaerosacchariphilus polymeriproducens]